MVGGEAIAAVGSEASYAYLNRESSTAIEEGEQQGTVGAAEPFEHTSFHGTQSAESGVAIASCYRWDGSG